MVIDEMHFQEIDVSELTSDLREALGLN